MSKNVAILATHGFEEVELTSPKAYLEQQGWTAHIISPEGGSIKAWAKDNWGGEYKVDKKLSEVSSSDYDALVLPGGVMNPDTLRTNKEAVSFVKDFFNDKKPVAAICHGPQLLIEADVVNGREVTSYPSLKTDLKNAGASWSDEEVVTDQGLVTSRTPEDLDAFNKKMVEEIKEGKHERQHA